MNTSKELKRIDALEELIDPPRSPLCRLAAVAGSADCRGCIHSRCSGYAYWCAKDGCKCSRGGVPKQAGCFQPNVNVDASPPLTPKDNAQR